jgi:GTP-binding protein
MTKNKIPEILLVGLPNSGKSTLINALTKSKTSIIGSKPNTTRDKVTKTLKYENNKIINISDLPGFLENPEKSNINYQKNINKFMSDADKIFFVIDIKTNDFSGLDSVFKLLSKSNSMKNVITIFNKCEDFDPNNLDKRLYKYIGESHHFVSAYHKIGLEELLLFMGSLSVTEFLTDEITTSLTIVGRPNAGKSTLFNSLLNNERSTVSDVPGTTRDKIKEALKLNDRTYSIVDTAGVPRKKQKDQIDRYSSQLAINSLENAHIALIVIDSTEGLSFEDKRILKSAIEENVTPVLILNKWDKLNTQERDDINKSVKRDLKQYKWISLIRISALNKKNINLISKQLDLIEQQLSKRITTSELNTHFRSLWTKNPPHPFRGKRAKLKYVTQYSTFPPEFAFTLSGRIPKNYEAFIENYIRDVFKMNLISFRIKINA